MSVSRHYRGEPDGEVPVLIWSASLNRWLRVGVFGPRSRRYNPASRVSKALRQRVFKRDNYTCQWPGGCKFDSELTIDHVTPVSRGGSKRMDNLQTLCARHNGEKARQEQRNIPPWASNMPGRCTCATSTYCRAHVEGVPGKGTS